MSAFSTIACYAALTSCSQTDIVNAYARMVAALIRKNRYDFCTPESLSADFYKQYGFHLPYHPMQTIINECINLELLTYNSSIHKCVPNYDRIDCEDFMDIVKTKDSEYKKIIDEFRSFLIDTYDFHASDEELNDRILAFVERYGIKAATDRSILRKIKDDFLFSEFLVKCIETDNITVLDYLDEYTIGLSLSEIFTYCEKPETYTAKDTSVYLDTNVLFRLLGIGSSDHSDSYQDFLRNMRQLGMRVKVYDHTIIEMIGIIEGSKCWIGNPDFDASLASEATYYFVSKGWSVEDVDELSCNLRTILQEDFKIIIDNMPYPKTEDIRTPHEAEVKEMIIAEYRESNSSKSPEEIDYSINQDAKSIFFTQHKNSTVVPYHINDVKNIFITSNRSLARVGYQLSYRLAGCKECFIPTVMTDIKWGTLLWFNSPANISTINRPRLVSAAYAAFRPSEELTKKLNATLTRLEAQGDISPEQCYLLKVNPVAQRLLAKKTINDPERFVEETPLEILKELSQKAFEEGSSSRQQEIDELTKKNKKIEFDLAVERQKRVVRECENNLELHSNKVSSLQNRYTELGKRLEELESVGDEIDKVIKSRMVTIKAFLTVFAVLLAAGSIYVGIKWSWVIGIITLIFPVAIEIITLWNNAKIDILSLMPKLESSIRKKIYSLRRYSEEAVSAYKTELSDLEGRLDISSNEKKAAESRLNCERLKMKEMTVDI